MTRIFLIHGYVEDSTIFDQLVPLLPPADYVRIDLADEFLQWQPKGPINVQLLAQYLAEHYHITASDVVIGHSMGGWVAINIKQLTGATAIQLASWTDPKKINFPIRNLSILKFILNTGLMQSRFVLDVNRKRYPLSESSDLYTRLLEGTVRMSRPYMYQQHQTLFALVPPPTVQPDLRIHARRDNIVFPPSESFTEVPGDHFSLVFYPELVAEPIRKLLDREG